MGECYESVGDLSEALALVLPDPVDGHGDQERNEPLHRVIEDRVLPLALGG